MNDNFWHGLIAIGALGVLMFTIPLMYRTMRAISPREWRRDQPLLFTCGMAMNSIGVLLISTYRTFQIWFGWSEELSNVWTSASLGFLAIGSTLMIWAGALTGARWKWRLYVVLVITWTLAALIWP